MNELSLLESGLVNIYDYKKENERISNARELHEFLEVGRDFTSWIKNKLNKYQFTEGEDYFLTLTKIGKNENVIKHDYYLKLHVALNICRDEKANLKSAQAYEYLSSIIDKEVIIIQPTRKEVDFKEMLFKITGVDWITQYSINKGKYRLDFYLPCILIIEYDEKYHEDNLKEDLNRIIYCREWLNSYGEFENYSDTWRIPVIRVKEGEELEGLNRIIKHLIGFDVLDEYNYNLEYCDIGNEVITIQ